VAGRCLGELRARVHVELSVPDRIDPVHTLGLGPPIGADAWAGLAALKPRYDPNGILTPGPGILP